MYTIMNVHRTTLCVIANSSFDSGCFLSTFHACLKSPWRHRLCMANAAVVFLEMIDELENLLGFIDISLSHINYRTDLYKTLR